VGGRALSAAVAETFGDPTSARTGAIKRPPQPTTGFQLQLSNLRGLDRGRCQEESRWNAYRLPCHRDALFPFVDAAVHCSPKILTTKFARTIGHAPFFEFASDNTSRK